MTFVSNLDCRAAFETLKAALITILIIIMSTPNQEDHVPKNVSTEKILRGYTFILYSLWLMDHLHVNLQAKPLQYTIE